MDECPPIRTTSDSAESTGEGAFNFFRIPGRTGAGLFFGSTTLKVVEKAIRSISNGADRTEANGAARIGVGGSDPILGELMGPRDRGTPRTGSDLAAMVPAAAQARTAIADTMTMAGGGLQRVQRRLSGCVRQMSPGESSVMAFETSLSATWSPTTIQGGMTL